MLSVKLIETVLVEQDPEGLISLGAPDDEYEDIATQIYNRLIEKQNQYNKILHEKNTEIINYIGVVAFVMAESFGNGIQYRGDEEYAFWFGQQLLPERQELVSNIWDKPSL